MESSGGSNKYGGGPDTEPAVRRMPIDARRTGMSLAELQIKLDAHLAAAGYTEKVILVDAPHAQHGYEVVDRKFRSHGRVQPQNLPRMNSMTMRRAPMTETNVEKINAANAKRKRKDAVRARNELASRIGRE